MCGGPPSPERPTRKRSRDPERARFVTGGIPRLFFFLFGLPFFCGGLACLFLVGWLVLGPSEPPIESIWNRTIGVIAATLIGVAHTAGGFLILRGAVCTPEWLTIDRRQRCVRKQTGILCFRRMEQAPLDGFTEVAIFPISSRWSDWFGQHAHELFEVALTGPPNNRFAIGRVTLSYSLAREFAGEVATFLGLPIG